jgi:anti-sigma regulatory factor (Ser/Thr protein kinase)
MRLRVELRLEADNPRGGVVTRTPSELIEVVPSARRLTGSLRDIGYEPVTAIADLIDNSISAGASRVSVELLSDGKNSCIRISDDGCGMNQLTAVEALRFGTRRTYADEELGRFGLGLKTASLSMGRRLTVVSRRAPVNDRRVTVQLDLDEVERLDRWVVRVLEPRALAATFAPALIEHPGTTIVIEDLDRVLEGVSHDSGWAVRRLRRLAEDLHEHLGMVFHRFIEKGLEISVDGELIRPWDPFCRDQPHTVELPTVTMRVRDDSGVTRPVHWRPFVLPAKNAFTSLEAFERAGGPRRWNRQQGIYVYRADRLVQTGGWAGLRGIDEHTKLGRAALEFETGLDSAFGVNVAKMRVAIPTDIRPTLKQEVTDLVKAANNAYRTAAMRERPTTRSSDISEVGEVLRVAAQATGDTEKLEALMKRLSGVAPEAIGALGF